MKITRLCLLTAELPALRHFYGTVLGLPVTDWDEYANELPGLRVEVGYSELLFYPAPPGHQPFYHVAFSVPHNQLAEAQQWVQARAELLPLPTGGVVANFVNWNAHAFYFLDPGGNVLECIARHDLPNASTAPFSAASLLGISEVGLVVADVPAAVKRVRAETAVDVFSRGPVREDFAAIGDDRGLLILVREGRPWFPTSRPAESHYLWGQGVDYWLHTQWEHGRSPWLYPNRPA
ncbi:glyoxalase [Hymenobacter gummosus]|uniref:Glyoxalase n=1 Tax=Hymenobacter gummosus TaxID=1776032 RepID=A0A431U670_9BACT|nr:glyoxalase [Hymenobacter gummosus]RTQ51527.1 glyoxalase [Hymenobacter gummosus]